MYGVLILNYPSVRHLHHHSQNSAYGIAQNKRWEDFKDPELGEDLPETVSSEPHKTATFRNSWQL